MRAQLSVIIPVYNEEKNIPFLYRRLKQTLRKISNQHEIIFVDDGSTDSTIKIIRKLRSKDKKIKILTFSRNFGHMPAVTAGLTHANGKKIVIMDADLQDPPEVIESMWKENNKGYDVVYAIKKRRKEVFIKRFLFDTFYRLLNSISSYKMPVDSGTFSLINKKVADILISLPEKNKYLSGLRSWTGFNQTGIIYERGKRHAGKPMSFRKLLKLAMDGFVSFSYVPLRLASFLGFITASVAFIFIIIVVILRIVLGFGLIGWASTLSAILLFSGVQLITLGIIGEYLARIYDEVKQRPEYIIAAKIGFDR